MRKYYIYGLATAILLPLTLIFAYLIMRLLSETPQGDTSFAWMMAFLIIFITPVAMLLIFGLSFIRNKTAVSLACILVPIAVYFYPIIKTMADSLPKNDSMPLTVGSLSVWLISMLVCITPGLLLYFKHPE